MESKLGKRLVLIALVIAVLIVGVRGDNDVASLEKAKLPVPEGNSGGGGGAYGGGGCGWGWGGPGGSGGGGGGEGGAGIWRCECKKQTGKGGKHHIDLRREKYKKGEFAECMGRGRCKGMKLECPLHCGGPCLYDCTRTCTAFCKR